MRTTKPKILRNLARIFPTFLRPVLFGVRKLACAFPEPEQLHTNKGSSKPPHSKETVDYSFGCGWAALCSSVFICGFRSYFWLRLCCAVKLVASFSVYTSEIVSP